MLDKISTKKIGVFGYGVEGRSLVNFLISHGVKNITVYDEKEISDEIESLGVSHKIGAFKDLDYTGIELAYRSPGIKLSLLREVLPKSVEISSSTNLFFELAKGKKIIITGTKGKSTTANIIYQMLADDGLDVHLGGNVGNSLLDIIDDLTDESYTVAELSSFQLQDFKGGANCCVYLPILIDHLDYHQNYEEYVDAKMQATVKMGTDSLAILPLDKLSPKLSENADVEYFYYSLSAQDSGCYLDGGDALCQDSSRSAKIENISALSKEHKIPVVDLLASVALAFKLNLDIDLDKSLKGFSKPKYRIEKVSSSSTTEFLNDSASTNPISTIEALKIIDKPSAVIMGGSSKGLDYSDLAQTINANSLVRAIFLIGETAQEIGEALDALGSNKRVIRKNNLDEVFEDLVLGNLDYKCVLFSPASASFDQYGDYKERGEAFANLVGKYFK